MFCNKCGAQLSDGVCPNCGVNNNTACNNGNLLENLRSGFSALGSNKNMFFINLGLVIVSFITSLMSVIYVDASEFYQRDYHRETSLFGESGGVFVFALVLYALSVAIVLLPLALKKEYKGVYFLPERIATIFGLLFFTIGFFDMKSQADEAFGLIEVGITFVGWIFLLSTIAACVISFKLSSDLKKARK